MTVLGLDFATLLRGLDVSALVWSTCAVTMLRVSFGYLEQGWGEWKDDDGTRPP